MVGYGGCRYLPEEIIFVEILSRLPAPIVVQFKRVCKQWNNSISSQSFAQIHLNRRSCFPSGGLTTIKSELLTSPNLLSENGSFSPGEGLLHPTNNIDNLAVTPLHSCDGLIVLSVCAWRRHHQVSCHYYICNPVISYTFRLPPPPRPFERAVLFFDEVVNRYKIVGFGFHHSTPVLHLFDFAVGSSSWKTFTLPVNVLRPWMYRSQVPAMKGCLYSLCAYEGGRVLSIDITSGDTCLIKFPPRYYGHFYLVGTIEGILYGMSGGGYCRTIWVLLPNLEWAVFHHECTGTTYCDFRLGYENSTDSSVSIPHNTTLDQIWLLVNGIPRDPSAIAHMDTLVSLEDHNTT